MSTEINIKKKIAISEESTILTTDVSSIDFVGAGVTASTIGNDVTVTINGAPMGVSSVGLSMPSAFTVTNSPIISSGIIGVTGAGTVGQYIRGDGTLANFPGSTGGGASLSLYLNGSVSQGTLGGVAFKQVDRTPVLGAGTDFTINANGYIQSFITDIGVPGLLEIPGGNWNFETYFSASSSGGTPSFYVELYKWDGTTLSLIASNSANPEGITGGTVIDLYITALAVPQTTLLATDRLAVRIYVTHSGRTIKLHTEDSHLCQIITTFSTGLTALNGLTAQVQNLGVGTTGTDFAIVSSGTTHMFNLPTASATNRGALSSANWTTFNNKVDGSGTINKLSKWTGASTLGDSLFEDNGTRANIGGTYIANTILSIQSGLSNLYGINVTSSSNAVVASTISDFSTAIAAYAAKGTGVYAESSSSDFGGNTGVYGKAFQTDLPALAINTGGKFEAYGGAANYSVQLVDGSEASGKFLKSVTATGQANWATITAADVSGAIDGSGTLNYVPKWTPDGTSLGDSLIYSSSTTVQIGQVTGLFTNDNILRVIDDYKYSIFRLEGTNPTAATDVLTVANSQNGGFASQHSQTATAIQAFANLSSTLNIGIKARSQGNDTITTTNIGIWAIGGESSGYSGLLGIGGKFEAVGVSQYAVQLIDGTETVAGRFLKNMTTDGKANWATLTVADTGLTLNTTGTTGAATLVGNTLSIPQHTEAVAFSPQDVSSADTAPTAASTQYYYQTISTVTGTISKVKLWGFSGTDLVRFGIYRGTLGGSMTLIGQGSLTCGVGPNEISLTAEVGQTLKLVVGENLVVGYYADGTSWRTIYDVGISDVIFGITNTANITTMPATPTGTATGIRFACTLYS
jgi:hypothetical protein